MPGCTTYDRINLGKALNVCRSGEVPDPDGRLSRKTLQARPFENGESIAVIVVLADFW